MDIKLKYLPTILIGTIVTKVANAYDTIVDCSSYTAETSLRGPDALAKIVCPIQNIINTGFLVVGGFVVIMIIYGAIKAALSLGDPRALMGAKNTWTWTIFGAMVILLSLTIITIIMSLLGNPGFDVLKIFDISKPLSNLWNATTVFE